MLEFAHLHILAFTYVKAVLIRQIYYLKFFTSLALYIKLSIFHFSFTQKIENFSQKIGKKRISRFRELNFGSFF